MLLGVTGVFIVGYFFNKLAEDHNKKGSKYIFIGVVFYILSCILCGIGLLIFSMILFYGEKEPSGLIIPILALLPSFGLYSYLKKRLEKNK